MARRCASPRHLCSSESICGSFLPVLTMLETILSQVRGLQVIDLIDIALVTTFVYSGIVLLRHTHARLIAIGILFLGALYIAARAFDLRLTTWLLQGFFAVFL